MDLRPMVYILVFFSIATFLFYTIYELEKERSEPPKRSVLPGYLQRRNERWKIFSNIYSTEGKAAIYYKKTLQTYIVTEDMFHEEVMSSFLDKRKKGLHYLASTEHGKSSYITNFLCTSFSAEHYALCNTLIFYHRCSVDDTASRDTFLFLKRFSETIISLYPDVGQTIYFNQTFQMYFQRKYCLLDIFECTKNLILEPLQNISTKQPGRKHIILVDFLDECLLLKKTVTINGIIRTLIKYLPEQFMFLLISRHQDLNYELRYLNILSLDDLIKIRTGRNIKEPCVQGVSCSKDQNFIGYCSDSPETVIQIFIILSARYVQFSRNYEVKHFQLLFCCLFIPNFVALGPVFTTLFLLYQWYLSSLKKTASNRILVHIDWFYKLDLRCDNIHINCIVDRRLEKQYGNLNSKYGRKHYNDWFYKLHIRCNNIDIDCIVDRRLEEQYGYLKSLEYGRKHYKDYEGTNANVKKTFSDTIERSEFEAIIHFLNYERAIKTPVDKDLNNFLLDAAKEKQSCLCKFLLYRFRNINMYGSIHKAFGIALKNEDIQTARFLSWCITKTFYNYHQEKLSNAINIYPGLRCICKEKSSIKCCFSSKSRENFVIVVVQQEKNPQLPNQFIKIDIEYVSPNVSSRSEGDTILEYLTRKKMDSFSLKLCIPNQKAQTLFLKHNNLGLICPSIGRSRFFSSEHHTISDERCIQLHCTKKGIIPIGNEHFPNIINGCPTDVIEAQPLLLSNLRIGDKVGPETSTGTLGGFVKYLDVFDCFLTCAHVMYDVKSLLESSSDFARLLGAKAFLHTPQGQVECGNVIWRAFGHDDISRTSVDAALVLLSNGYVNPSDILSGAPFPQSFSSLGLTSPFLNTSCLDHEEFCIPTQTAHTISAGAMTKMETNIQFPRQSDADVQFSNTGPTTAIVNSNVYHPLWTYSPAHLQLPSGYLTDRRIFRMYNQIALNLPLVQGDSGTCIYIVNHPDNKNGCIGMAIATSGGLTLVTPLKDILKRINTS